MYHSRNAQRVIVSGGQHREKLIVVINWEEFCRVLNRLFIDFFGRCYKKKKIQRQIAPEDNQLVEILLVNFVSLNKQY